MDDTRKTPHAAHGFVADGCDRARAAIDSEKGVRTFLAHPEFA